MDTYIAVVLDRSGSMSTVRQSTIDGFNEFLAGQKAVPGTARLKLVQFDNEYTPVYDGLLSAAEPLTDKTYVPRGSTALLDAIGRTINEVGTVLSNTPPIERPKTVIVAIMTDGEENASLEFSRQQVFDMIGHQRNIYKWEFVFLGANQDAIKVGASFNINASSSITYDSNPLGVSNVYTALANNVSMLRRGLTKSINFTEEERNKAVTK
jgi:hypothetical protein